MLSSFFFLTSPRCTLYLCQNRFLAVGGRLPARAARQVWYGGTSSQTPAGRKCLTCTRRLTPSVSSHILPDHGEAVFRTTVEWTQGLFTALVKAPCVPQELQVYTWIVSLLQTVYQIALWSPGRLVKRTNIGKPTYSSKIIAVSAVDRSQNSTQPSKSMPLSKELKSSLPDPAPDREQEFDAVLPEMPPGAPRGYSM